MRHVSLWMAAAVVAVLQASVCLGYGLFTCYAPDGREIGVVDSGTETGLDPTALCNARLAACAGQCSGARRFVGQPGHRVEVWHYPEGIPGNNTMVPNGDTDQDARRLIREGLAAPTQEPGPNE